MLVTFPGRRVLVTGAARGIGRPDDIAHPVLFLASDFASWITGQALPVTGGPVA